jgi:hypothetical protein
VSSEQPTAQEPEDQNEEDELQRPTLAELFTAVDQLHEKIAAHLNRQS